MSDHLLPALDTERSAVYHCRAEDLLAALPTGSVDLIVTSPPYDNLRTYNGFAWDFETIAHQAYRVLKQGGVMVWVVGDATIDGSETLTSMRQALYFKDVAGFRMHDTMIWHKITPGHFHKRYTPAWEFMFVFTKSEPATFSPLLKRNNRAGSTTPSSSRNGNGYAGKGATVVKEWGVLENVWSIQGGTSAKDRNGHPAAFPEKLAERHILTWSNPGDLVVDFFGGSGTTAKMARINARRWITCDISEEYCELMRRRLAQPYTPDMFALAELQQQGAD